MKTGRVNSQIGILNGLVRSQWNGACSPRRIAFERAVSLLKCTPLIDNAPLSSAVHVAMSHTDTDATAVEDVTSESLQVKTRRMIHPVN